MKIFLTGGTGFLGSVILKELLERGFHLTCLVRPGSEHRLVSHPSPLLTLISGDITQPSTYVEQLEGTDFFVHLVGIIREFYRQDIRYENIHVQGTQHLVEAAQKIKPKRFFYMSALGARRAAPSRYHQTKFQAEEIIRKSGLNYTIFQPSVIFGRGDQFINMLARMVRLNPVTPLIGGGTNKLQPIAVEDVSKGVALALTDEKASNKTYPLGGLEIFSFKEILNTIKDILGIFRPNLMVPLPLVTPAVKLMERFSFFPLTSDQLTMLKEDNICDPTAFFEDLKISPMEFREGVKKILRTD